MTDTAWTMRGLVRAARHRGTSAGPQRSAGDAGFDPLDPAVASGSPASRAALHTAAAERLAEQERWEPAYRHLREAVRLLHGQPPGAAGGGADGAGTALPAGGGTDGAGTTPSAGGGTDGAAPTHQPVPRSPQDELDRLRREHAEAHEQSRRDSLTASYNRRYLDERLAALLGDGSADTGLCMALADIDHFKQVNDTHGHQFGDRVLQRMVVELGLALPEGTFCARYGGEEFALVLPGRDLDEGIAICEAARDRIATHEWSAMHPDLRLTISIGVARTTVTTGEVDAVIGEADELLYTAKQAGRNAVAYRRDVGGRVELAGAAGGRRSVPQPATGCRPGAAGLPTAP